MEACGKLSFNLKELLQCSICLGELTSPRALPCLHSFCQLCLERHIRATTEGGKVKKIHCPTCRISIPASKCSVYDFPKDFRIVKLRDALQSSRSQRHKACDVCSDSTPADIFCVDCEKSFCRNCSAKHQAKPVSSLHVTIGLYNTGYSSAQTPCKEHEKEHAKFFCASCGIAVCALCIFGGHRDHDLTNLNETLESKREDLRGCLNHMRSQLLLLQDAMFQLTCMEGQLKGQYEEGRLKVRKHAQGIVSRVQRQEALYLSQLDQSYQGQYDDVSRRRDQCRSYITHFSSLQSRLESVLRVNDVEKVSKAYYDVLRDIQQVEITDKYKAHLLKPPRISISSPEHVFSTEHVADNNISNDGGFPDDEIANSPLSSPTTQSNKSSELFLRSAPRVGKTTAKLLFKIGGCGKSAGQLCLPYGLAFLEDESLMVAENGNSRLQVFDKLGRTVKVITMVTCIPRCIAPLADDKFAIADELGKCVKIIDICNETMETFVSDTLAFPFGVACLPNDQLVVSDMIFENVSIISPEGEKLMDFGSHGNSDVHFDNPSYLATDIHGNIFVSDSGHHEIKVFDSRGTFQFKFGGYGTDEGQLKYPKGVAVSPDGVIYVADAGNNRVVMFSRLGFYMSTLLDRNYGVERPTGLAYHPAELLAVSMPDRHEVNVYQLVTDVDPTPEFQ